MPKAQKPFDLLVDLTKMSCCGRICFNLKSLWFMGAIDSLVHTSVDPSFGAGDRRSGLRTAIALVAGAAVLSGCAFDNDASAQASPDVTITKNVTHTVYPKKGGDVGSIPQGIETEVVTIVPQDPMIAGGAPVNIIYIDVNSKSKPNKASQLYKEYGEEPFKVDKQLLESDPLLLKSIKKGFATATFGHYVPESVSVTKTDVFDPAATCLDKDKSEQNSRLQEFASKYAKKGSFNLITLPLPSCSWYAGYGGPDFMPIISKSGFNQLPRILPHEWGHVEGIGHAGVLICKDAVNVMGCERDPLFRGNADNNSIMGYVFNYTDDINFTAPELEGMGALKPDEIINNPKPGVYELSDPGKDGAKVINLNGGYRISWERDSAADSDKACRLGDKAPQNAKNVHNGTMPTKHNKTRSYVCYEVNQTGRDHSLQVRQIEQGSDLPDALFIPRPSKVENNFGNFGTNGNWQDGYTEAGETVLNMGDKSVIFNGETKDGKAMVRIVERSPK